MMDSSVEILTAACLAHRACCGVEHNPEKGKLHGCCVVCGVPWPCDTAKRFLQPGASDAQTRLATLEEVQRKYMRLFNDPDIMWGDVVNDFRQWLDRQIAEETGISNQQGG